MGQENYISFYITQKVVITLLQNSQLLKNFFTRFQGYILGNPLTSPSNDNYIIPFAHGMALISDELYNVNMILTLVLLFLFIFSNIISTLRRNRADEKAIFIFLFSPWKEVAAASIIKT